MFVRITWLGHASVMLAQNALTVYIDPWKLSSAFPKADLILITHEHYDHFSVQDIERIRQERTRIIAPFGHPLVTDRMEPFETLTVGDVRIATVPSYNISTQFHPRGNNWVGYIVTMAGKSIYHTGDTDHIPEMQGLAPDVVLLPVGGTYTMDATEACQAAFDIGPRYVIPIHYGDIVGSRLDALTVRDGCPMKVEILNPGGTLTME